MSLPTFVGVGGFAKSAYQGAINPSLPTGIQQNDILILGISDAPDTDAITIANSNGGTWNEVSLSPYAPGNCSKLAVFWSRYNGTQGAPTTSASSNNMSGVIIAIRGCLSVGDPIHQIQRNADPIQTTFSIGSVTTTIADCFAVLISAHGIGNGSPTYITWTNANLANLTERADNSNNISLTTALAIATGEKATAGAFGSTTGSVTNAVHAHITLALAPVSSGQTITLSSIVTETDECFTITPLKSKIVILTLAQETELPFAVARGGLVKFVDQVSELDTIFDNITPFKFAGYSTLTERWLAGNGLLAATTDSTWQWLNDGDVSNAQRWTIDSNFARFTGMGVNGVIQRCLSIASGEDYTVRTILSRWQPQNTPDCSLGLILRHTYPGPLTYYLAFANYTPTTNVVQLYKCVNGSFTQLGIVSTPIFEGMEFEFQCVTETSNTRLKVKLNKVLVLNILDSTSPIATGRSFGIFGYAFGGLSNIDLRLGTLKLGVPTITAGGLFTSLRERTLATYGGVH